MNISLWEQGVEYDNLNLNDTHMLIYFNVSFPVNGIIWETLRSNDVVGRAVSQGMSSEIPNAFSNPQCTLSLSLSPLPPANIYLHKQCQQQETQC